jgi:hypothetical protein
MDEVNKLHEEYKDHYDNIEKDRAKLEAINDGISAIEQRLLNSVNESDKSKVLLEKRLTTLKQIVIKKTEAITKKENMTASEIQAHNKKRATQRKRDKHRQEQAEHAERIEDLKKQLEILKARNKQRNLNKKKGNEIVD